MSPCSLGFLASVLLLAAVFAVLRGPRGRQILLGLANAGFIASFHPRASTLLATAGFLLASWGVLSLSARRPSGKLVLGGVTGALAFLIALKAGGANPDSNVQPWVSWSDTVGLSYMVFKFIHVLVDVNEKQVRRLSLGTYLNYQLAFFTLTAGPINRYNDFEAAWSGGPDVRPPGPAESFALWSRIFSGAIKMAIVASALGAAIAHGDKWAGPSVAPAAYLRPLLQFYLFPLQIYFDFSGYTDIMIGCAGLLGFKIPENFDRPFGARNLVEFWNRWHMSLTHWLRVYVFMAAYRFVAERHRTHLRAAGYVLLGTTLVLFGLWHGFTDGYFVFGVVSGLGVVATQMWGDMLSARLGRAGHRRYLARPGIRGLAVVATFHFFCFSELFFARELPNLAGDLRAVLDEFSQSSTAGVLAALPRLALLPAAASLLVLAYSRSPRVRAVATAGAPSAPAPGPFRSFASMTLRAGVLALFLIEQAFDRTRPVVGFYRTF